MRIFEQYILSVISELAEYREKERTSIYYNEAFGITPEQALQNAEKLQQMEQLVASLEAEVCLYKYIYSKKICMIYKKYLADCNFVNFFY